MLMHTSKGGVTLDAALDLDIEDFDAWCEAANVWNKKLADAMK